MSKTDFLRIEGITAGYGQTPILKDLDLSIRQGEFVALLGSSGCGKTTLLRSIAGFVKPTAGAIRVDGRVVTDLPPDRRGTALVFQSYALWPHMTVAQNIGYGLKLRGVARADIARRVEELQDVLGLAGLGQRKPPALSGGQRQRVALGRALAVDPAILLLDEPLSNLDARIRLKVRHEISALQKRLGITAVHVTHDREEAMVMADRIVILDAGAIVQQGSPEDVFNRPASPFVAAFMGAENVIALHGAVSGGRVVVEASATNARAVLPLGGRDLESGAFDARFRAEGAQLIADRLSPSETTDGLDLFGHVEAASYLGGAWRHSVRVGDDILLVDAAQPCAQGQAVRIRIPASNLFIFNSQGRDTVPWTRVAPPGPWKHPTHESCPMETSTMKKILQASLVLGLSSVPASAAELTVLTAGDQNMVDYINEYLAPLFEEQNPGDTVRAVGTGPGDAGSQKIVERFEAQKQANAQTWDTDVAVVHEKFVGPMVKGAYLDAYRDRIPTGKLVTRSNADMALGSDVKGYVMPMFNSQTALAYNPALLPNPPRSYEELAAWVKENPKQFGYNGIKGGASGVSFVMGWIYAFGDGDADKLMNGPFEEAEAGKWNAAFDSLADFTTNATLTPGNAGTLDLLSRGEIAIGPVWVDMFYSWQANGQLPPEFKLVLPAPGMPGQPMHYVIPQNAPNRELAEKFVELATSPKVQAEGIVERFNWYPGIDAQHVQAELDEATWNKLFTDVSPEDLASYGKPFPIAPYNDAILEAYERHVTN